jgi:hypothetical protein
LFQTQVNPLTNKNIKHVKEQSIVQEFHLNINIEKILNGKELM